MGDDQEKTEATTEKHRSDARKQGTVAKSTDLTHSTIMIILLLVLPMGASWMGQGAVLSARTSFSSIPTQVNFNLASGFMLRAIQPVLSGFMVISLTIMGVGVAMNLAQVGFVLSPEALKPSFNKINPLTGIKRLLSVRSLFEAAKNFGKSLVFALIGYMTIHSNWQSLTQMDTVPPLDALAFAAETVKTLITRIAMAWAAMAALDYFFQRQQIEKQLRMTKQEVKREMKDAEMAPELKAARNARRRRLMRRRLRDAVKSADVIVTNPTHFAVAIKYEPDKAYAPIVVAKGADYLAAKIREEAALNDIPLVPNAPLARALYKQCEIGDYVPRELFQAVAEVLAYVYKTLKRMPKRS